MLIFNRHGIREEKGGKTGRNKVIIINPHRSPNITNKMILPIK